MEQNINYGGDQIVGGQIVNVGRDLALGFTTKTSNPHKSLWDAIAGIGASHRAEQQYSRGECLEGTREEVLRIVQDWMKAEKQILPIFWLSGAAGVEKSAIAMTIARFFEEDGLLSSFFFFRSDSKRNNPSALMLAIAHGLTVTIPSLRRLVNRRISRDPRILEARIEDQFRDLVLKPSLNWRRRLRALAANLSLTMRDPNLVIIDGLDECGDAATQLRILATIANSYQHSPHPPLRFLICSRSESWIRQAFKARPLRDITQSIVLDDTFSPAKDIERYLVHELEGIRESPDYTYIEFPTPWPSQEDYDFLVTHSDGQFVYVVTAVKFVKIPHCNPVKQLRVIIDNAPVKLSTKSPYPELDNLYHVILAANPDHDLVLTILAAILLLPHGEMDDQGRTQSPEWLGLLLGLSSGEVILALRAMHSVLDIRGPQDRIRVYHTSFTDYLSDPTRSGEFYINKVGQQYVLAQRRLQALSRSQIHEYSSEQLYKHPTNLFFTGWMSYCVSLPKADPALLDDLGDVDISCLFFCMVVSSLRKDDDSEVPTWSGVFEAMATWLSSSADTTAVILAKRFKEQPKVFHIELINPAYIPKVVHGTDFSDTTTIYLILRPVSIIAGCDPAPMAIFRDEFPSFRVKGCYCPDLDPDITSSYHSGHYAYQAACLQVLKEFVPSFQPYDMYIDIVTASVKLLESSLLLHCPFEPELFSLCGECIKLLGYYLPGSSEYETELLEWLETCPDSYTSEADTLRAQVLSIFRPLPDPY
ncbi:hypothetical protein V5O48_016343 [Marasmius crinis-equi]|uniref:Nephrocystin 3-like N-terminal domain-containing protein n=1 Tax=Marasmius crinis-equi TaxID=585013 RepID=A0ABR3ES52_9AGAR